LKASFTISSENQQEGHIYIIFSFFFCHNLKQPAFELDRDCAGTLAARGFIKIA
jgi:hypothetical protein